MKNGFFIVTLFLLPGCAVLGLSSSDDLENDPITKVASDMRNPNAGVYIPAPPSEDAPVDQLVMGMSMSDVKSLWGNPQEVGVAGSNARGNERWVYYNGLSAYGTNGARVVYFEQGRVAGWQTQRQ